MKCNELWLRQWINPKISREKLCKQLTMAGFEVEEVVSAKELGCSEDGYVIDIAVTPNRGDCMCIRGLAREVSAITRAPMTPQKLTNIQPTIKDTMRIQVKASADCPRYVARIIRGVKANLSSPTWLINRLCSAGIKSISPVVDIANYVMLELGQPMHAFDLNTLENEIMVRQSKSGEKIALLDGTEKILNAETLVIADQKRPLAIAGVMGDITSSVTLDTTDILLESAFFTPETIARQRQYYGIHSESSHRFERGVDPTIQREAISRATQLILEIVGGKPGPVMEISSNRHLKKPVVIQVTSERIERLLGITIPIKEIDRIFKALGFKWQRVKNKWRVVVPSYRFDLSLPEDLIEEVARLYGYDNIPMKSISAELATPKTELSAPEPEPLRQTLAGMGYNEIISYSFVDKKLQVLLDPEVELIHLANPITDEMTTMRTMLWPGLINTLLYNKSRQQQRIRLFEIGTCFNKVKNKLEQELRIGGIVFGSAYPEQWGMATKNVDFFDIKGDIENLLKSRRLFSACSFHPLNHPALHPGQAALICHNDDVIGKFGALHPRITQTLELTDNVFAFEFSLEKLLGASIKPFQEISKFPEIRRDIAILIKQAIPSEDIQDTIRVAAGDWLNDVFIFDVYQGKGVSQGCKSLAVALILQHPTRTLVDEEVMALTERVINALKEKHGAELRS